MKNMSPKVGHTNEGISPLQSLRKTVSSLVVLFDDQDGRICTGQSMDSTFQKFNHQANSVKAGVSSDLLLQFTAVLTQHFCHTPPCMAGYGNTFQTCNVVHFFSLSNILAFNYSSAESFNTYIRITGPDPLGIVKQTQHSSFHRSSHYCSAQ